MESSTNANAMLAKLEAALAKVNEEYAIHQHMPMAEKENHPAPTNQSDHEVNMARSDLYRAGKSAMALEKMLQSVSEQQGIEGWVQAKITKAADYLESVYHYFDYEMHGNGEVDEAAAYGPGDNSTNPEAEENTMNQKPMALGGQQQQPQAPGAPQQSQQLKPGQASATPQAGGAGPTATSDGMVKMAKLGPDKKPIGIPVMVKPMEISAKQKQGFFVIGEAKEEKKVVHCSQCSKGFSSSGLTAPHHTGFSHCKDHKGMKIVAESASAGATSAGGMGASPTGFASGGIGMQKRKKKKIGEGMMVSRADADAALKNPEAKAIWGRYGQYNAQDLTQEFPNLSPNDAAMIANWAEGGWVQGHTQAEMRGKLVHSILQLKQQGIGESEGGDYGPKARGIADGYYGRPPNPHKVVTDETGKRMRVKLTDPAEIAEYMAGYKDDSFGSKDYGESVAEAGFGSGISTPTMRARTASKFGHDPDRAAPMYKANKYDPKTGLGGYVAPRGDTTDKSNILLQLKSNLDIATGKPLTFQDGSTLEIKPSIARTALAKIEGMRPVEKHETIKNLMTSKDAFVSFIKGQGESKETGPKFTGYWKGKDKGKPGKKMVGDA